LAYPQAQAKERLRLRLGVALAQAGLRTADTIKTNKQQATGTPPFPPSGGDSACAQTAQSEDLVSII
jgi:hypothetical protein